jgi:16S rRNA (guanine527-N7)-methyltransferase
MITDEKDDLLWQNFALQENLSEVQLEQFKRYYELLTHWNAKINLTRIITLSDVIMYHFQDSLSLSRCINVMAATSIADIGSGAGFPAIPLKIVYPHLSLVIIEVSGKRVSFLREVIKELGLLNIIISILDWRTFLRQTHYPVDYFCARASLSVGELLQFSKPSCWYRSATLVYWASEGWEPEKKEEKWITKEYLYVIGAKKRKLVVFSCFECII